MSVISGIGQGVTGLIAMRGGMNKNVPQDPGARNYEQELQDTLAAIQNIYPEIMARQAEWQPQATATELSALAAYDKYWKEINPSIAGVQNKAASDLALGNRMSMTQQRGLQQDVRAAQSARGFGYSPGDAATEALNATSYRDALEQQRYGNALSATQLTNPYLAYMGTQQPNVTNMVMANPYAQDVYSGNWNKLLNERYRAQNFNDAMKLGGFQALSQSFSTAGKGVGGFL